MQAFLLPLREAVVGVQGSLASAAGLSLQAVGWNHHEDEVWQRLVLPPVQVVQVQTLLLLIAIHALNTHTHMQRVKPSVSHF